MTSINGNYLVLPQNYYQNSQIPCATAFRGGVESNSLPAQTIQPSQLSYPPDTVEISAKDKIQNQQKEKGMSTATKVGLAVVGGLATTYACVVGHRMLTKPSIEKVAQNFSEIFRRDISKDEAQKMVNKYKDIFKEDDVEKFCTNIFEQVKKDYGFEKANIKLKIKRMPDANWSTFKTRHELASYSAKDGVLTLCPSHSSKGLVSSTCQQEIFENVIHELQHALQSQYAYRTNVTKYIEAMQARSNGEGRNIAEELIADIKTKLSSTYDLKQYMKENNLKSVEEAKKELEGLIKVLEEKREEVNKLKVTFNKDEQLAILKGIWGNAESFKVGSKEYELGSKYIDNCAHYINPNKFNYEQYKNQLIEKEAFGTEPKAKEIYNCFANPWRIF